MDTADAHSPRDDHPFIPYAADLAVLSALRCLVVVLADDQGLRVASSLVADVADVVSDLITTSPPMPPLQYPERGADDDAHVFALVRHAVRDLRSAATTSPDPWERLRAGVAAHQLVALTHRWQP